MPDALRESLRQRPALHTLGPVEMLNPNAILLAPEELAALLDVADAVADYIAEPNAENEHRLALANLAAHRG